MVNLGRIKLIPATALQGMVDKHSNAKLIAEKMTFGKSVIPRPRV
jgi:hypothetical protein